LFSNLNKTTTTTPLFGAVATTSTVSLLQESTITTSATAFSSFTFKNLSSVGASSVLATGASFTPASRTSSTTSTSFSPSFGKALTTSAPFTFSFQKPVSCNSNSKPPSAAGDPQQKLAYQNSWKALQTPSPTFCFGNNSAAPTTNPTRFSFAKPSISTLSSSFGERPIFKRSGAEFWNSAQGDNFFGKVSLFP